LVPIDTVMSIEMLLPSELNVSVWMLLARRKLDGVSAPGGVKVIIRSVPLGAIKLVVHFDRRGRGFEGCGDARQQQCADCQGDHALDQA
jgi:hypothetical protein